MSELVTFMVLGLAVGAVYALTAQGLVLIYRGSGVVNFAQGAYSMIGAFVFHRTASENGWGEPLAWLAGIGIPAVLGGATHLLLMTRLRQASALMRLVSTLGVFTVLVAVGYLIWGRGQFLVATPLPNDVHHLFGARAGISEDRFWIIGIALVVTVGLWAFFRYTPFGRSTEAVAENAVAAAALGKSPDVVATVNWALGAGLAALAGILIAPILFLNVGVMSLIVLRALAAALVGRFYSFWRTLIAALVIGMVETLLSRYIVDDGAFEPIVTAEGLLFGSFSAQSVAQSAAFLIIVVVLFFGGRSLPVRGELFDRLPALGSGRISVPGVIAAAVAVSVLILTLPPEWVNSLQVTMAVALICLSLVVLTGLTGQISLAQMALAGMGAWVAGHLVHDAWPLLVAMLVAVIATVLVGALFAVPALRTRGVNLALLTFGLAVVLASLILQNPALTGGVEGLRIQDLNLWGISIDSFVHPERYAFFTLVFLVVAAVLVSNVRRSGTGLRLIALRSNERAAAAVGLNSAGIKVYAFALAAGLAAIGGILLSFRQRTLVLGEFNAFSSVHLVVFTVIGGIGFVTGALIAGGFAPGGLGGTVMDSLGFSATALELVSGIILLVIIVANPSGLAAGQVRLAHLVTHSLTRRRAAAPRQAVETPSTAATPASPAPSALADPSTRRHDSTLTVTGLTVRFGSVTAVEDVALAVGAGEVLALIGPNGAGKTTLIDALTGFVSPERSARITLDGQDVQTWGAARRARLGIARSFQSLELFEDLTVRENLLVSLRDSSGLRHVTDLVRPRQTLLSAAGEIAVQEFGLLDDLDRLPNELSHGRRRLVAIARAVASDPAVLLLDEPAAGLSEEETTELARLIRQLADSLGIAILVVEHDMSFVRTCSDRVAVLNFGRLIAHGAPTAILEDPAVVTAYLGFDPGTPVPAERV